MEITLQQRLRATCEKLRRTPMPIADIIPLLQEAANELDKKEIKINDLYDEMIVTRTTDDS
jgi:hypothetical protein